MVTLIPTGTWAAEHPSVGWPSLTPVHEVGMARKTRVPSVITNPAMHDTPAMLTATPGWIRAVAAGAHRIEAPAGAPVALTPTRPARSTAATPTIARTRVYMPTPHTAGDAVTHFTLRYVPGRSSLSTR